MSISIVHISDLHLRSGWAEEQGLVLNEFFADLAKQLTNSQDIYLIFTGDILQVGGDFTSYQYFTTAIQPRLVDVGLNRSNTIFVPGNHDINRSAVAEMFSVLKALQEKDVSESEFNTAIYTQQKGLIYPKFENFINWQMEVSDFALSPDSFCGKGFTLSNGVGIYCLNTSLYSFGGMKDVSGAEVSDEGRLPIETRRLHEWLQNEVHQYRILALHHPKSWLTSWATRELERISPKFDLILCGHTHENNVFHKYDGKSSFIESVSPPIFTTKNDILGYSIVRIEKETPSTSIQYRQWAGNCFVSGTFLSKNDEGIIRFGKKIDGATLIGDAARDKDDEKIRFNNVHRALENNLHNCLKCYASLPEIWVTPNIADQAECSTQNTAAVIESADIFCNQLRDCLIKAPPQFGLSSLGHYIALKVWTENPGRYVLYLKSSELQNHESAIATTVQRHLSELGLSETNLEAFVIDESGPINDRKINNIKKLYPNTPLIILHVIQNLLTIESAAPCELNHRYQELYLWSLDRTQVREITKQFINAGSSLDEDSATQRIVDDLERLNFYRTPMICITLLTVYQNQIDYSPTNRTEMMERFLHLVFSAYKKNPNYSSYPDMKDSFYVLGNFCESLIRDSKQEFSKHHFISDSNEFCKNMMVDVDCARLFEVLEREHVLVQRDNLFSFKYVHWIYFFAAHRMHHNEAFKEYILSDGAYIRFPEVIEFYSGIDRRRDELLDILIKDLRDLNNSFEARTNIGHDFDPYSVARWASSGEQIEKMKSHVQQEMKQTSLPKNIKDLVADQVYDRRLPYVQEMNSFIRDSSLLECCQIMRASALALRNSDYADKERKKEMLDEILRTWSKVLQALVLLSPVLAKHHYVSFENMNFALSGEFHKYEGEELLRRIQSAIPANVVSYYEKDFSSVRLTPLLANYIQTSSNEIGRYIVAAELIRQRPLGWLNIVKTYMESLERNSFYLLTTYKDVHREHKYGFYSQSQKAGLEELFGVAIARHEFGSKKSSKSLIKKAKDAVIRKLVQKP